MHNREILYHYTNLFAIDGIFKSKCIWATDYRYLNDKHEFEQAKNLFLNSLSKQEKEAWEFAFWYLSTIRLHCVFSLSKSPEVLSQWRGYADDGQGMALGFSKDFFNSYADGVHNLVDCIYDNHKDEIEKLKIELSEEIQQVTELYHSEKGGNAQMRLLEENATIIDSLFYRLLAIKNSAFKEEQEVRFVTHCNRRESSQRVSRDGRLIIPYMSVKLLPDDDEQRLDVLIPHIYLGPKSDKRNGLSLQCYNWVGLDTKIIRNYDCGYQ